MSAIRRATCRRPSTVQLLVCGWVSFVVAAGVGCSASTTPVGEQRETLEASFLPAGTRLVAWQSGEGLCMEARWDTGDSGSGACQFRDSPTGGRYAVGGTDTGFLYAYGPVPAGARTVRLALTDGTTIEAQTAPLPPELAKGRYFLTGLGKDAVPQTVTPLDGDGQLVTPQDF